MRTTNTSITKTCRACGTVNTLVIMTAGIPPRWGIGCSKCRHAIVGSPGPSAVELAVERAAERAADQAGERAAEGAGERAGERSAVIVPLPVPAMRRGRWLRPAGHGRGAALPALDRRQEMARRIRGIRASARASSGVSLAAICGIVIVAFVLEREPTSATVPAGLHVQEGTRLLASADPAWGLDDRPAPVYTHPPLAVSTRPANQGVPPSATAAAGDPGYASIVDLRRPLPEVYPDPREGMMALDKARLDGIALATATAEDEDALAMSASTRREVQRRLRLASHDPRSIDGVFGPMTRTAIAEWQAQSGLPASGYLDGPALAMLVDQTRTEYSAWRTAERQRREREQQVAVASVRHQPASVDGCARLGSGEVAYGQSVRCDFKGLRESVGSLRGNLAGLFGGPRERRQPDGA